MTTFPTSDDGVSHASPVLPRLLLGVGLSSAVAFVALSGSNLLWLRLVTKAVPIASLMIWLLITSRDRYATLILAGLAFSLVGDVVLEASDDLFVLGLVAFLIAHLWYIAAFLSDTRALKLWWAVPFAVWLIVVYLILLPNLHDMAVPVSAYVVVIGAMMWRASARLGQGGAMRPDQWAGAIGAVLFGVSDMLIALNRFNEPIAGAGFLIIGLYWLGQLGITLSARPTA